MVTDQDIVNRYNANHTMRDVGRYFNIHYETVRQTLLRNGIKSRGSKRQITSLFPRSERFVNPVSGVYIIQGEITQHIKIGISDNVNRRLYEMQCQGPDRLVLIQVIPGEGRNLESRLHDECAAYRLHGEWFSSEALRHLQKKKLIVLQP